MEALLDPKKMPTDTLIVRIKTIMNTFLEYSECRILLNTLNEVCRGIGFSDMQKVIGAEEETVLELEERIRKEKNKARIVIDFNDIDKIILMNSIDAVIEDLGEEECGVRLGVEPIDMIQLKEKLFNGKFPIPDPEIREVADIESQNNLKCCKCGLIWEDRLRYPIFSCHRCHTKMYNPLFKEVVCWRVESPFSNPCYYEIREIPHLGYYLCLFVYNIRKKSYLLKTLEEAESRAKEEFSVPKWLWKRMG